MPRSKGRTPLSHDRILGETVALIDREGFEGFSMRRLAAALGVQPMAIYHYFPDKQALLHGAIHIVLGECETAGVADGLKAVERICRSLREVSKRHPALFLAAMNQEVMCRSELAIAEGILSALVAGGIDEKRAPRLYNTLITYVTGFCCDEITGQLFMCDQEAEDFMNSEDAGAFPMVSRFLPTLSGANPDGEFDFGLSLLMQSIQHMG
ncbi:transcriptional regulator, TetR family [Alkalispirochaeta americana]|uniref:Transcriptional regulator, TetR family n=1 Tax=Alkalispirochaeta americana TaxID=159291 RepID=A0A1N6Q4P3_9SPIO|nr:TetR/AcrR family transcriptional regulator [Alkalispirochaeta americana]SIQ11517.1 transcriptional regulator, TetR family [Alkalispirochaeta americana]